MYYVKEIDNDTVIVGDLSCGESDVELTIEETLEQKDNIWGVSEDKIIPAKGIIKKACYDNGLSLEEDGDLLIARGSNLVIKQMYTTFPCLDVIDDVTLSINTNNVDVVKALLGYY